MTTYNLRPVRVSADGRALLFTDRHGAPVHVRVTYRAPRPIRHTSVVAPSAAWRALQWQA